MPKLLQESKTADGTLREVYLLALWELRRAGASDHDEPGILKEFLRGENDAARRWAAERLGNHGPAARPALISLVPLLREKNADLRAAAATAIGKIGTNDKEVVAALTALGTDSNRTVRLAAVEAIARLGPPARPGFPDLDKVVARLKERKEDRDKWIEAQELAIAAVRLEPKLATNIVRILSDALWQDDMLVIGTLHRIGPAAREAVPALIAAHRRSKDAAVRKKLLAALAAVAPDDRERLKQLADQLWLSPGDAVYLKTFGSKARHAVPQLIDALETHGGDFTRGRDYVEHYWSGEVIVDTLEAIGPDAKAAVPLLLKLHDQSKEPYVYLRLARALKKIDPAAARKAGIP